MQANGQASGPVLLFVFLVMLAHSGLEPGSSCDSVQNGNRLGGGLLRDARGRVYPLSKSSMST